MVVAARDILADPSRLIVALDIPNSEEAHRWSLRQLVEPADQEEPASESRDLETWNWLGQVILKAVEKNPALVLAQGARLIGDLNQQMNVRSGLKESYELKLPRLKTLFGDQDRRFLELLAGLPSQSDDWGPFGGRAAGRSCS